MNTKSILSKNSLVLFAPVAVVAGALLVSGVRMHTWVKGALDKNADTRTVMNDAPSQDQKDACGSGLFVVMAWQCLTSGQNGTGR